LKASFWKHLFISLLTVEEMLRGALAAVQRVTRQPPAVLAYQEFGHWFEVLHVFQIVAYPPEAE
jgi:tRNA(fMet)-specific endonuclease VapC